MTKKSRYLRKILSSILAFMVSFIYIGNGFVYAAHDVYTNPNLDKVENRFLSIHVDKENGRFIIRTLEGDPNSNLGANSGLLANSGTALDHKFEGLSTTSGPQSTFTTIRINGKDYIFGNDYSFLNTSDGLVSCKSLNGYSHQAVWKAAGIEVTQQLDTITSDEDDKAGVVRISYKVHNTTGQEVNAGTRILLDTCTSFSDYTPFILPGEEDTPITRETVITGDDVPQYWKTETQYGNSPFSQYSFGLLEAADAVKPDKMIFGHWSGLSSTQWEYYANPSLDFTGNNAFKTADSGVALYWDSTALGPGETKEYTTYYGVGLNLVSQSPLDKDNITYPEEVSLGEDGITYEPFTIGMMLHNTYNGDRSNVNIEFVSGQDMYQEDMFRASQISAIIGTEQVNDQESITVPTLKKGDKQYVMITAEVDRLIDRTTLSGFSIKLTYNDAQTGEKYEELFPCSVVIPALKRIPEVLYTGISPGEFHFQEPYKMFYIQGSGFDFIKAWQRDKPVEITFENADNPDNIFKIDAGNVTVKSDNIITFWTKLGEEAFIKDAKYKVTISTERFGDFTFPGQVISSTKEKYRSRAYGTLFVYRMPGEFDYNIKVCDMGTNSDSDLFDEIWNREEELYGTVSYNNSINKYIPLEVKGRITGDADTGFRFENGAIINNTVDYRTEDGGIGDLTVRKYAPDTDHDSEYVRMDGTGILALADMDFINGEFGVELEDGRNYSVFYDTGDVTDTEDDDMGSIFPDEVDIPIEPVQISQTNPIKEILQYIKCLPIIIEDIILRDSSISFGGYAGIFINGDLLPDFNKPESTVTTSSSSDGDDGKTEAKSTKVKKKMRKNRGKLGGGIRVYDIRYGKDDDGKFELTGIRTSVTVAVPQGIIPGIDIGAQGTFMLDTYGEGYIAMEMDCNFDFDIISGFGKLRLEMDDKYGTCIVLPDTLAFEIGVDPGIPIFPPIIIFSITRGGGGIYNLAFSTSATDVGEKTGNLSPVAAEIVAGIADPTGKIIKIDPARIHVSLQETSVDGTLTLLSLLSFRIKGAFGLARRYYPHEFVTVCLTGEGEANIGGVLDALLKLTFAVNPYNEDSVFGPIEVGGQLQGTLKVPVLGDIVKVSGGINSTYVYARGKALGGKVDVGAKYAWADGKIKTTVDTDLFAMSGFGGDKDGYAINTGSDIDDIMIIDNFKRLSFSKPRPVYMASAGNLLISDLLYAETSDTSHDIEVEEDGKKLIRITYDGQRPQLSLKKPDGTDYTLAIDDTLYVVNNDGEESEIIYIENAIPGTWHLTSDKEVDYELIGVSDIPGINSVEVLSQQEGRAEVYIDTDNGEGSTVKFYLSKDTGSAGTYLSEQELSQNDGRFELNIPGNLGLNAGQYYIRTELVKDETNLGGVYSTSTITVNDPDTPKAPENIMIDNAGNNLMRVTWDAPDETADGYLIEVLDGNGDSLGDEGQVYSERSEGTSQEAVIKAVWDKANDSGETTGMENGKKYKVSVTAYNEIMEEYIVDGELQKVPMKYTSESVLSNEVAYHEADPPELSYTLQNEDGELEKTEINGQECYISSGVEVEVTLASEEKAELRIQQDGLDIGFASDEKELTVKASLEDGINELQIAAVNDYRDSSSRIIYICHDSTPPELLVESPVPGQTVSGDKISVKGITDPGCTVNINGEAADVDEYGNFTAELSFGKYMSKTVSIDAKDRFGNKAEYETKATREIDASLWSVDIGVEGDAINSGEPAALLLYGQYTNGTEYIIDNGCVSWSVEMGDPGLITNDGAITLYDSYPVMVKGSYEAGGGSFAFEDIKKLKTGNIARDQAQVPDDEPDDEADNEADDGDDADESSENERNRTVEQVIDGFLDIINNVRLIKSGTIKPDEDTLFRVDDNVSLSVPAGTFGREVVLKAGIVVDKTPYSSGRYRFVSDIYEFETDGEVVFNKPVKLVFRVDKALLGENKNSFVYWYNPDKTTWEYVGGDADFDAGTITVELSHFSKYAVMIEEGIHMEDMEGRWSEDDVNSLIAKGIVKGVEIGGKWYFRPTDNITRQEFTALLARAAALEINEAAGTAAFSDEPDISEWAAPYMAAAYNAGWLKGTPDGKGGLRCNPRQNITRTEAAVILGRVMELETDSQKNAARYKDDGDIPVWAEGYVAALSEKGIIKGFEDNTYRPVNSTTREEAAAIISRYLNNVTVPLLLGGGYRLNKLSVVGYNPPLRMHGRADDEVIDQPTLFKRHVQTWRTKCSVGRIHFARSEGVWGFTPIGN